MPTYEEVLAKLREEGVVFGLKEEVIHRLLEEKSSKVTMIAEGVYPTKGETLVSSFSLKRTGFDFFQKSWRTDGWTTGNSLWCRMYRKAKC